MTKLTREAIETRAASYGRRIPGCVVVHNHHAHRANTRNGTNGFRWWSEVLGDKHTVCNCGWQPKEPPHYKIAAKH